MLESGDEILEELKSLAKLPITIRVLPRVSAQVIRAAFLMPETVEKHQKKR